SSVRPLPDTAPTQFISTIPENSPPKPYVPDAPMTGVRSSLPHRFTRRSAIEHTPLEHRAVLADAHRLALFGAARAAEARAEAAGHHALLADVALHACGKAHAGGVFHHNFGAADEHDIVLFR